MKTNLFVRTFAMYGVMVLLLAAFSQSLGAREEGADKPAKRAKPVKHTVILVQNGDGKLYYEAVPANEAAERMKKLVEEGKEAAKDWGKLSKEEKKETAQPKPVRAKIARSNLRDKEAARKAAKGLTAKLPKSKRADGGGEGPAIEGDLE